VQGISCTASVLRAYAVMPAMERWFTEDEEQEAGNRVVIISNALWKSRYGADARIIGRKIRLNGEEHDVVGVMPEDFHFSSPWYRGHGFELWTPIILSREEDARDSHHLVAVGRLKGGMDWQTAVFHVRGTPGSMKIFELPRIPRIVWRLIGWARTFAVIWAGIPKASAVGMVSSTRESISRRLLSGFRPRLTARSAAPAG